MRLKHLALGQGIVALGVRRCTSVKVDTCSAGQALGYRAGVRLKHLALGQGMGARAAEAVEAGAARGLWVLLQNCHLLPRWLPALDALLERLDRLHKACGSMCCSPAVVK